MRSKLGRMSSGTALMLLSALSSCGDSDGGARAPVATVRDSAGVEIVSSPTPIWDSASSWNISETPSLTIGSAAGDEAYTLFRVSAAIRLHDGRIAIANRGTAQIRIYDPSGQHLKDLGRRGEGPGEFMLLMDLWRASGDSIVAADNRLGRLTIFDEQGRAVRTIPLEQNGIPRQLFGRRTLEDGTLLVSGAVRRSEPTTLGLFDGGTRQFDRYSAEGRPLNRIGELPQSLNWGFDSGNPYGPSYTSAPFSISSPPNASDGKTVFLGDGTLPEVRQLSPDGELLRIVRWGAERRPVTSDLQDGYRHLRLEGANTPELRRRAQDVLDGIVFPDYLPVYEALMTDSEGHLWVKPYTPEWEADPPWWVFDRSGRWLGEITIPGALTVLDIGPDYVLGAVRDEQDVERVVLHALDRGRAG